MGWKTLDSYILKLYDSYLKKKFIPKRREDLTVDKVEKMRPIKYLLAYGWYWDGGNIDWGHFVAIRDGKIYDDAYAKGEHGKFL